ncbi:MAG: hypothetical protein IPJ34_15825 [Myxococcales bacterium]|nr:hypothetical protein [Myxococcales bacterium]
MIRTTLLVTFALGCSSNDFGVAGTEDAKTDHPTDVVDTGKATTDTGSFTCANPSHCDSTAPYCCATFELGAGSLPSCPMDKASTRCRADCPTQIPLTCPSPGQVKVCRNAADCATDPANPRCCKIFAGGVIGSVCVSAMVASYAMSCD